VLNKWRHGRTFIEVECGEFFYVDNRKIYRRGGTLAARQGGRRIFAEEQLVVAGEPSKVPETL
jgi:hypothetical protein